MNDSMELQNPEQKTVMLPIYSKPSIFFQGQIQSVDRLPMFTKVVFLDLTCMTIFTNHVPEFVQPGNTIEIHTGMNAPTRIKLLKTMPNYKIKREAGNVIIEAPDGKTLATIPADQAKTFADVEREIFEQNKGKGNAEECVEATNYFLINGITPK